MKFSVVLPTYNERENLPVVIKRLISACKDSSFEVIVVDDNSPDKTYEAAKFLARKIKNVRVFVRERKMGLSSAILLGVRRSKYKYVCVMDADLQHPPELVPLLVRNLATYDIVIASRYLKGSKIAGLSFFRKLASRFVIYLIYLFFPQLRKIKDPLSGFFAFKKSLIKEKRFKMKGFKFLLELLLGNSFSKIKEVPFEFGKRKYGKSKAGIKEGISFLYSLLKLRFT